MAAGGGNGPTTGLIARGTLVVLGIWALANLLWLGREVVFVAFFAVLVASFLSIFVDALSRVGVPRGLAAPLVLGTLLLVVGGLFRVAWPELREQVALLQERLPQALDAAGGWLDRQYRSITGALGEPDDALVTQLRSRAAAEAGQVIGGALPLLNTLAGAAFGAFLILFSGMFMAIEPRTYARGVALLVPRSKRRDVMEALVEAGAMLRRWMGGTVVAMLTVGVVTGVGLALLGVPAALVLGLIAGLLEFVPYYGPILSTVPAVAVALAASPGKVLWVLALYTAVQQLEANLLHPLIMRNAVELPPALTLLWSTLMGVLFGFLGLVLAVPILVAAKVLIEKLYIEEVTQVS